MTLSDSLLKALKSIDDWLIANPDPSPERQTVVNARIQLRQAMNTAEAIELDAALNALGEDAANLQACTQRLVDVANTLDKAQDIADDVGKVVGFVARIVAVLAGQPVAV
jgi:hypothetical protein